MAFHAQIPGFSHGWLGVDVFFVISGYLTAKQLSDGRPAGVWLYRRWARLHPALLLVVLTFGPIAVLGGMSAVDILGIASFVYTPWFHGGDGGLFGHTWTITVEVVGYIVGAALLPTLSVVRRSVSVAALTAGALLCLLAPWETLRLLRPEGILLGWAIGLVVLREWPSWLGLIGRPLGLRPMRFIGERTYSLYLWHLPLFLLLRFHTGLSGPMLVVTQFVVTVVCAEMSFRFVEVPMRGHLYAVGPKARRHHSTRVETLQRSGEAVRGATVSRGKT